MAYYNWDVMGNLTGVTDYLGRGTTYTYDLEGNLTGITDASGRTEQMTYDVAGRLLTYTSNGGNTISYDYDKLNNLVEKSYTDAKGKTNGESVVYAYNALGERVEMYDSTGETEYIYDSLGRITSRGISYLETYLQEKEHLYDFALTEEGLKIIVFYINTKGVLNMPSMFKSFIPKRISNKTVIRFYDLFRKLSRVSSRMIAAHKAANRAVLSDVNRSPLKEEQGYIENQREWKEVLIGKGKNPTMQKSGCGVFAVYNALLSLEEDVGKELLTELIASFEKQGVVLSGRWGVSPRAIYRYFLKNGFDTAMTMNSDPEVINRIGREYAVSIVTVYNNKEDIMYSIHTVCVTKNRRGEYFAHNAYYRKGDTYIAMPLGEKGFACLQETIEHLANNPQVICVIGINKSTIL